MMYSDMTRSSKKQNPRPLVCLRPMPSIMSNNKVSIVEKVSCRQPVASGSLTVPHLGPVSTNGLHNLSHGPLR